MDGVDQAISIRHEGIIRPDFGQYDVGPCDTIFVGLSNFDYRNDGSMASIEVYPRALSAEEVVVARDRSTTHRIGK